MLDVARLDAKSKPSRFLKAQLGSAYEYNGEKLLEAEFFIYKH